MWEPRGEKWRQAQRLRARRVAVRYLTDKEIAAMSRLWAGFGGDRHD